MVINTCQVEIVRGYEIKLIRINKNYCKLLESSFVKEEALYLLLMGHDQKDNKD